MEKLVPGYPEQEGKLMEERTYEVCIIGAGIAGATLAHDLAEAFDVCLVEKKPFGELGRKPCGNAVHRSWLEHDGVEPDPERFGAVSSVSRSISLHLPGEELKADLGPERELLILNKEKLVKGLVSSALDRGCDLVVGRGDPEVKVGGVRGVDAGDASIGAETYVDASGSAASLRENFEPTPPGSFFPGYREIVDASLGDETCHAFQPDSSHALWAFPAGERANVGGVLFRENGASLKPEVRHLRRDLGLDGEVLNSGFGPIPSSKPIDLVYGNVVAIGDAGFTSNPLTGGGIGPSIRAANLLADALRDGGDLEKFQQRYMDEVASRHERNYYLSRILLKLQGLVPDKVARWTFKKFYGGRSVE